MPNVGIVIITQLSAHPLPPVKLLAIEQFFMQAYTGATLNQMWTRFTSLAVAVAHFTTAVF